METIIKLLIFLENTHQNIFVKNIEKKTFYYYKVLSLFFQLYEIGFEFSDSQDIVVLLIVFAPVVFGKVNVLKLLAVVNGFDDPSGSWGEFTRLDTSAVEDHNSFQFS